MKEFFKKIYVFLKSLPEKTWYIILTGAFLIFLFILIWQRLTYTFITAEFKELRPTKGNVNVFYKGYKIGKVLYIKPSDDFKTSYAKIALFKSKLKLPSNISIKLQREKDRWRKIDYIEIIYPEEPSKTYLRSGDLVLGKSTVDIETYFSSQETDSLDEIKENLLTATEELSGAIEALKELFNTLNETVLENQNSIKTASRNFAEASKNLNGVTLKLNNSIKEEELSNSVSNLNSTISKIDDITTSLNTAMPVVSSGVVETNTILKNLSEITCGISDTLKKRFGGLRLIFGKTIDENCTLCK